MPKRDLNWAMFRNAITHVRVPVTDAMRDESRQVIANYLPRLIELYRRIAQVDVDEAGGEVVADGETPQLPIDLDCAADANWLEWRHDPQWEPAKFAPWMMVPEATIRKWLGLEF
jgi:hypothetical protein